MPSPPFFTGVHAGSLGPKGMLVIVLTMDLSLSSRLEAKKQGDVLRVYSNFGMHYISFNSSTVTLYYKYLYLRENYNYCKTKSDRNLVTAQSN